MSALNGKLLSTTIIPALMGVGGIIAVTTVAVPVSMMTLKPAAAACNPCAAKKPKNACNPCAAKKACGACNPCAAKKACSACNPCAAKNPCAANACNPCAAKKSSSNCVVPSVQKAAACNPCAAKKPCGACNPCGAKSACGACNPCAAKKACGACNPCAAKKACGACNPCAAKKACGACNPCAAKKACNPCNPCAAKNPCAANACNPCNPCNPCGPCGAAAVADVELEPAEANSAYDCLKADMKNSYAKSGIKDAGYYMDWKIFSTAPYASGTHGGRHVSNYGNAVAEEAYALYEEGGKMPVGSVLAKDSFAVQTDGRAVVGPLFMMEKMAAGFNKASGNWKYTLILPNGQTVGTTNGQGSGAVTFCYECHMAAEDTDSLFFLPEEVRVN